MCQFLFGELKRELEVEGGNQDFIGLWQLGLGGELPVPVPPAVCFRAESVAGDAELCSLSLEGECLGIGGVHEREVEVVAAVTDLQREPWGVERGGFRAIKGMYGRKQGW